MSETKARLNAVFCDVFDDESIQITEATTAKDIDGWDSLNHVNLVVAAERAFKIKFTTKEITGLADVGAFLQLIDRKLGT